MGTFSLPKLFRPSIFGQYTLPFQFFNHCFQKGDKVDNTALVPGLRFSKTPFTLDRLLIPPPFLQEAQIEKV